MLNLNIGVGIQLAMSYANPDLRMSRRPPGTAKILAHDYSVDDGAHGKPPYEPRGYDLPETEKMIHAEFVAMEYPLAELWFDVFTLCAPSGLEKLTIIQRTDQKGIIWLNDYWYNKLSALEQWWLFLIYWARAFTNKKSIDLPGYLDPITKFGDPSGKPFEKEGVTTCGNMLWIADGVGGGGVPFWCIDATPEALPYLPSAEKLLEYPFLCHAATVSTVNHHNPNPQPNAPKGTWDVDPFWGWKMMPIPMFSTWKGNNAATMEYDGMKLRVNWFTSMRILPLVEPWNPYFPARPLR
jgi:hypothetical protein